MPTAPSGEKRPAGWPALVGGGLVNVALGTYYAWSVFVPALEREFGWNRAQTSLVPTIDMVMLASMFLVGGFILDRLGPRKVTALGGILYSAGLFLASLIHSLPMLYLTWGVLVGAGLGLGYLSPITVGSKWFPDHRGLVNGLAIGIFAAGSGIFGPIAGGWIVDIGWRTTFQILAGLFFVFTMTGAYLLKDPPPGYAPPRSGGAHAKARALVQDVPTSQVIRTPVFYMLWFAYALGTTAGTMVISQLVPFARQVRARRQDCGIRDLDRRDRQRQRTVPLGLDVGSLRPSLHRARHRDRLDDRDAAASTSGASRCCRSTGCCSSSTTATARSSRSTPRSPAISGAPSISPPTTA